MITVRFLGVFREQAGTDDLMLRPQGFSSVQDILDMLPGLFKGLDISTAKVALNNEFVDGGEPVADGDEIAILPPVTGG